MKSIGNDNVSTTFAANKAFAGDFEGRRGKWVAVFQVWWPPPFEAPETRALAHYLMRRRYSYAKY